MAVSRVPAKRARKRARLSVEGRAPLIKPIVLKLVPRPAVCSEPLTKVGFMAQQRAGNGALAQICRMKCGAKVAGELAAASAAAAWPFKKVWGVLKSVEDAPRDWGQGPHLAGQPEYALYLVLGEVAEGKRVAAACARFDADKRRSVPALCAKTRTQACDRLFVRFAGGVK